MDTPLARLLAILRQHAGRENLIGGQELARRAKIKGGARAVRSILEDALLDGTLEELEVPVASVVGQGYFLCTDFDEAQTYYDFRDGVARRAVSSLKAVHALYAALGLNLKPTRK